MILVLTIVCAYLVGLALGRTLIPVLRALKAGQTIREIGPKWHSGKSGTPTMGGLIFIGGSLVSLIAGLSFLLKGEYELLLVFLLSLVFGAIGFADDFIKVVKKRNLGLTALQKLLLQLAAAALYLFALRRLGYLSNMLYIPFWNVSVEINWVLYLILAVFAIVGTVNAVNLTDGIDGLASGVTVPVMLYYLAIAFLYGRSGLCMFPAALVGGLLAFLTFNFHPAKVFMGDTGSLFLGGAVCGMAFALDMPLVLIPVGIVYIVETVSVMMQVVYFKLTHGKRIFKMTPIHHHFELCGWSEEKIFIVFVSVTVVFCVLAYLGTAGRF